MRPIYAVAAAAIVTVAACFSEREATAPAEGRCSLPLGGDVAGSTLIAIRAFLFQPEELRVRAGQAVTWVNCEDNPESHTSTADGDEWDSSVLAPGQAFTRTFDQVGTFTYICSLHPTMTGRVVVE